MIVVKQYAEKQKRTLVIAILLFLLLAATIIAVGYRYYRNFESQSRAEAERWLSTIESSKLSGLADWRGDLLNYANFIYKNQAFSDSVALYFHDKENTLARETILHWLEAYQKNDEFDQIYLLDARGEIILSLPETMAAPDSSVEKEIPNALQSGKITFVDFYLDDADKRSYLVILIPVIDESRPIGFLALRVDPQIRLYPYLAQQVTNAAQTQSFLVRRDGNSAVFLSPLKFKLDAALNLRIPLEQEDDLAVQSALGRQGIFEGVDYRGAEMIAIAQPVPDSPWLLVTHIGMTEVYAPVNENFGRTVIVTGTIIFYLGLGAVLIWRQRQLKYYQTEAEAAEVLRKKEEELRLLTRELDDKVRERTAELQDVNQQLRALSQQMVDLQEKQIKTLARELHDSIGQNLTAININLSLVRQMLPEESSENIRARLTDTTHLVEETVARMRNVIADFLPPMLERYGLSPALVWYGEQFSARTNIRVQVNDRRENAVRLRPEVEVGLFRIVQEALNNAAKHAHASQVTIEIKDEDSNMLMTIRDDGIGFDPRVVFSKLAHWGFAMMRERARTLDAFFDIHSAPGEGATIFLRIAR